MPCVAPVATHEAATRSRTSISSYIMNQLETLSLRAGRQPASHTRLRVNSSVEPFFLSTRDFSSRLSLVFAGMHVQMHSAYSTFSRHPMNYSLTIFRSSCSLINTTSLVDINSKHRQQARIVSNHMSAISTRTRVLPRVERQGPALHVLRQM